VRAPGRSWRSLHEGDEHGLGHVPGNEGDQATAGEGQRAAASSGPLQQGTDPGLIAQRVPRAAGPCEACLQGARGGCGADGRAPTPVVGGSRPAQRSRASPISPEPRALAYASAISPRCRRHHIVASLVTAAPCFGVSSPPDPERGGVPSPCRRRRPLSRPRPGLEWPGRRSRFPSQSSCPDDEQIDVPLTTDP